VAKRINADSHLERKIAARACLRLIERAPRAFVIFSRRQLVGLFRR
jgi:hypothetical protein